MNTIIEAKEIINKHTGVTGIPNAHETLMAMQEYAELYHTRKCEESGRELPTQTDFENWFIDHSNQDKVSPNDCVNWMKEKVSKLLSSLQSKLEAKDKEIERVTELMYKDCNHHSLQYQKLEREFSEYKRVKEAEFIELKSYLEAKDKEIEELKKVSEICPSCQDDESKMPCQLCDNMGRIPVKEYVYAKDDLKALIRTYNEVYTPRIKELESQLQEANVKVQTEVIEFAGWLAENYFTAYYKNKVYYKDGVYHTIPDLLKKYEEHKALKK